MSDPCVDRPVLGWRRTVVDASPVLVPSSMTVVFALLRARMPPPRAYNVGFAVYWAGWCFTLPLLVLGPRRTWRLLWTGRRVTASDGVLMAVPVLGGVATAFWPNRQRVDLPVASVMIGTAVVNAVGEELLWRGLPLAVHGDEPLLGCAWPLAGFAGWHLAPQLILVSDRGRWGFVAGAAAVGLGSAVTAWRARGVRPTLLPHMLTDACGVAAAEFRLGRLSDSSRPSRGHEKQVRHARVGRSGSGACRRGL